jgi:hypothetical protein
MDPKRSTRAFKEWFPLYLNDANTYSENCKKHRLGDDTGFSESISLKDLFGMQGDATVHMIWAARSYEKAKLDPVWMEEKLAPTYEKRQIVDEEEEVKYRILNIFKDEPLDTLRFANTSDTAKNDFSKTNKVVAGKPLDLIDALIFPLSQPQEYMNVFLSSYRFYISGLKLLESLTEWYFVDVDEDGPLEEEQFMRKNRRAIQSRVSKVILNWIQKYWQDFSEDPTLFNELMKFVEQVSEVSFGDSQKITQAIREQRLAWYMTVYMNPFTNQKMSTDPSKPYGLLWDPTEFAAQLTLLDFFYFQQVKPDSYLHVLKGAVPKKSGHYNVSLKTILDYLSWFRLVHLSVLLSN